MFEKKYIFETKSTRFRRYLMNAIFLFFVSFILYTICCFVLILFAESESTEAQKALYNKAPHSIVVYTGQKGRIPFALKKAKEYNQDNVFITGVHSVNSVNSIVQKSVPKEIEEEIDDNQMQIDYLARNTVENTISTLRYLRKTPGLKRILIISHDYHIMRIKLIMNKLNVDPSYEFYYIGISTNYLKANNIQILYKEVFKFFRTMGFLLFWN